LRHRPFAYSECTMIPPCHMQVAHFLNDATTSRCIVRQLADLLKLVTDWNTPVGIQLAAALQSMPVDLCSLIFESSQLELSYILTSLPKSFHTLSLYPFITPAATGQHVNLSTHLLRSCMHPLSAALTLQHCVHLDLTAASVGGPYPLPVQVNLPALTYLSLSRTRFSTTGALPFLASLMQPHLKALDLSYMLLESQMYAALATSVAQLTELTHIDLSHRMGVFHGALCSKLLSPLFSAASRLPALCCIAGASLTALCGVSSTLATLAKLPALSLDFSECSTALAQKLSAAEVPLQSLKVTLPPFILWADSAQVCSAITLPVSCPNSYLCVPVMF
jgi:hypothetical protein